MSQIELSCASFHPKSAAGSYPRTLVLMTMLPCHPLCMVPSMIVAHGSPTLITPISEAKYRHGPLASKILAPDGLLNDFLEDLGKTLIEK